MVKTIITEGELIERIRKYKMAENETLRGSPFYRPEWETRPYFIDKNNKKRELENND